MRKCEPITVNGTQIGRRCPIGQYVSELGDDIERLSEYIASDIPDPLRSTLGIKRDVLESVRGRLFAILREVSY